ncbi:MAG: diguanylate cyclase [Chitinispirillales bacterium]|jgi:diguanylate cyclase (GGDEF)-like protein|nr:diguanylate cyclase [Chitinispirillales bacterium]
MTAAKIYIVENDKKNAYKLSLAVKNNLSIDTVCFDNAEDAINSAKTEKEQDVQALVLSLKLSMDNYTPLENIATILITNHIPLQSKQMLLANNLVDTVAGYGGKNITYIINIIRHISIIKEISVLLIENESVVGKLVSRTLSALGVSIIETPDCKSAQKILDGNDKIRIIFIDGDSHDAIPFIRKQRDKFGKSDLPIVALINESAETEKSLELLRSGAMDCVKKEFAAPGALEYFHTRIRLILRAAVSYFEMEKSANLDMLTNTLNRRSFYETSENLFASFVRGNISISMIDIDDFKNINDIYGHSAGDAALVCLCGKIKEQIRKTDVLARFGGEEFCLLLVGTDGENAIFKLDRIRKSIEETKVKYEDKEFGFTISIGCCCETKSSIKDMMEIADKRLYYAKRHGKNCVVGNDCGGDNSENLLKF